MPHAYGLAVAAMREAPHRRLGEAQFDYVIRLRAWVANHSSNDHRTIERHYVTKLAAELLASAERYSDTIPESERPKQTDVTTGGASRADKAAYMRAYMRERRAREAAAAKEASKVAQ
jgi:hypothetical protein